MTLKIDSEGFSKILQGKKTAVVFPGVDLSAWLEMGKPVRIQCQKTGNSALLKILRTGNFKIKDIVPDTIDKLDLEIESTPISFLNYIKENFIGLYSSITLDTRVTLVSFELLESKKEKEI